MLGNENKRQILSHSAFFIYKNSLLYMVVNVSLQLVVVTTPILFSFSCLQSRLFSPVLCCGYSKVP